MNDSNIAREAFLFNGTAASACCVAYDGGSMTRKAERLAAATDGMDASTGVTGIPGEEDSSELADGDRAS